MHLFIITDSYCAEWRRSDGATGSEPHMGYRKFLPTVEMIVASPIADGCTIEVVNQVTRSHFAFPKRGHFGPVQRLA